MNHADLWAEHEKQNWGALWEMAVPVVQATVGRMKRAGEATGVDYDELIAEGNLVAGTAVREWRPLDTLFGSWVSFCVRRKLLNVIGQQRSRDRGRDDVNVENLPDESGAFDRAQLLQVRELVASIPDGLDQLMVRWFYGIECEFKSVNQIAKDLGLHRNSVRQRIELSLERLRTA
jgi:DNA-directed RNA polymerase specialized sigma24 family protein